MVNLHYMGDAPPPIGDWCIPNGLQNKHSCQGCMHSRNADCGMSLTNDNVPADLAFFHLAENDPFTGTKDGRYACTRRFTQCNTIKT